MANVSLKTFYLNSINSREEVIVPDTREIASSLEEEVDSEIRTSKPGQLAAEPSKKKSNRLSLSKRRKKSGKYHHMAFKKMFCLRVCRCVCVSV